MRFSIIGPFYPFRGGIAHFSAGTAKALINSGHQVQKISYKVLYPNFLYPGKSTIDPSVEPIDPQIKFILDPINPGSWKSCIDQVKDFKPDLSIIQWWTTFWSIPNGLIVRSLKRDHIKSAYIIHNVLPHEIHFWDQSLARYALKSASAFITLSTNEKQRLINLLPDSKIAVCHHPIYSQFLENAIDKKDARKYLGIPDDTPMILFFGIVRKYKGLDTLLTAFTKLKDLTPSPILVIAGEFWESKSVYLERIKELDLEEHVMIFDRYIPNDEVSIFFSAADMLVAAYSSGTQSGVIKSGMAFGLPIIVSENLAEGMEDKYSDRLFIIPPGDPTALVDAIQECILSIGTFPPLSINPDTGWLNLVKELESIPL